MFVKIKVHDSSLAVGTVVSYDSVNAVWSSAANDNDMIGVIEQAPEQDTDTNEWYAKTRFAGSTVALADRAIPDEGGELCVVNGRVYVDNTADGCGIIAPLPRGQVSRVENDLVMVHLR
jgi:hypothetical protein